MPSSTPSHASKRQNRSISTFFPPSTTSTTQPTSLGAPPLPGHLQASLINVGMRVRKSIAQGYKTKNTAFQPYLHPGLPPTTTPSEEVLDAFSTPPSSQESIPDNGITGENELKRGLPTFEEEEVDEEVDGNVEMQRSAFDLLMANRHLAIPKSQKKRDARRRGYHAAVLRKEVGPVVGAEGAMQDDFGDAGFLRPVGEVCGMDVDA